MAARGGRVVLLAVLAAALAAPAASAATPGSECCFALTVSAHGEFGVDYGSDSSPPHSRIGKYSYAWNYETRAIANYDRSSKQLEMIGPGLVEAQAVEEDHVQRVYYDTNTRQQVIQPEECTPAHDKTPDYRLVSVSRTSRDRFAVFKPGGVFHKDSIQVGPGTNVGSWHQNCYQAPYGLRSYGLNAELSQSVTAKGLGKKLRRGNSASFGCAQFGYWHDKNNGHTFIGDAEFRVTLTFFPPAQLDRRKKQLGGQAGTYSNPEARLGSLLDWAAKQPEANDNGHERDSSKCSHF